MKYWYVRFVATLCFLVVALSGCAMQQGPVEHYVSPRIQGAEQKINLEEVQKAFWDTKGKDLNTWMSAFEKRVNEIYDGKDVVSIDATRQNGNLVVTGYIDKVQKEGFQPGDDKLFSIEQTGEAANNEMPYRVSDYQGRPYYEGHHSILDNPFLQAVLISHLMGGWGGGRYYTPAPQVVVLRDYRNGYRQTPQFGQQQAANQNFYSRFKTNSAGSLQSSRSLGSNGFSSGTTATRRTWGGNPYSSSPSSFSWGGRRSSGGGIFSGGSFGGRRGWGGRRR